MVTDFKRLMGMPELAQNAKDVRFVLTFENAESIPCIADLLTITRIASGLGHAISIMAAAAAAENGGYVEWPVEHPSNVDIKKDDLSDQITIQLTTSLGLPYIFQIPAAAAQRMADCLINEAEKTSQIGNA